MLHIAHDRLEPPQPAPAHLLRSRLLNLTARSPQPRVLLVRAPAGYGKTTLLGQIARRLRDGGSAVAWLSLDTADNDAARFVSCLAAATLPLLQGGTKEAMRATDDLALATLEALAACTDPFTIVLDEFEHIADAAVLGLMRALISRLPAQAQLVIGARSMQELGLNGLRARGRVLELDGEALRFTLEETTELLSRGRAMPAAHIAALHQRAEGWPAALWLAAAALERDPDHVDLIAGFAGPQVGLARYFADDVLGRLAPSVRQFLLRTSILKTLNAALCDAVLGRDDSAHQLEAISRANLFLGAHESFGGEYRYHGLFAGFLRERLALEAPLDVPVLHDAASRWYAAQGRVVPAIDHAIAAGDTARSVALLLQHAGGLIADGRGRLLGRWFDMLPSDVLEAQPLLQLLRAWARMFERGAGSPAAQPNLPSAGMPADAALRDGWATLNSIRLALTDRYEAAWETGREPLSRLPSGLDFADVALINNLALSLLCLGRKDEARALVDASRGHAGGGRSGFNAAVCEAVEGMIDLQEARLREATARLRLATRMMQPDTGRTPPSRSFIGIPLAEALYEAGQLEAARQMLLVLLPLACNSSMVDHLISAHVLLARIEFFAGDVDRAFELLNQLEVLGHERRLPRLAANARLERSHVYVLQHHLDAARIELARCSADAVWQQSATETSIAQDIETPSIGAFRIALAAGEAASVLVSIRVELARALAAQRTRRVLKLRLFQALALFQLGEEPSAHRDLESLLRVASAEGFVRLLLDEGPAVTTLCRSLESAASHRAYPPILSEHLRRLAESSDAELAEPGSTEPISAPLPEGEALTARELRLLAAVADGYSNSAIAEKFFVSVHTVRGHLRSINSKLQVGSRTQAVAAARRLGWLR